MTFPRSAARTAAATALLVLGAGAPVALAQDEASVLRVRMHSDLQVLDPIATTAYISRNHGYMIYDTLFALDEDLEPQPQMVGDWSVSGDGLTYTFTLRDGLTFHDGRPVTGEDVVASLKRWGERDGMGQALMAATERLEPVDDRTFRIVLSEPYGLVLESLGKVSSNVPFIMPKEVAETPSDTFITATIGSGPFRFVAEEWEPGYRAVYERFEGYMPRDEPPSYAAGGKRAYVDRVEWLWIPDASTTLASLTAGEIDYWENPPIDLLPILEADPDIRVHVINPLGLQSMLRMNHLQPPFDDPRLRRAVAYVINQPDYMQATIGNPEYYRTCKAMFLCGTPLETDAGAEGLMEGNVDRARELMEEAGYDGTPVVIMQSLGIQTLQPLADITAGWLREAGFNVDLQAMDWQTLVSRRPNQGPPSEGGWNIFHTAWVGADILNPLTNVALVAQGTDGGSWFGWPEDEELEELRRAFTRESDPEERRRIAEAVQERAYEIVVHLPLGQYVEAVAYRTDITGVLDAPVQLFWNVRKRE